MLKAVQARNEDLDYLAHWQAFLNQLVKSRKKSGQPVYKKFKSFYKPPKHDDEPQQEAESRFTALAEYKRKKLKEQETKENGKL